VCYYDDWHWGEYKSYIGKNAAQNFIQAVLDEARVCNRNLSKEDFKLVGQRWQGEEFDLVTKKGIFPYEYMDDISKLNAKKLPSKDEFYSTLYESGVSGEDYERAQKVWNHFGMKRMKDYHDLYLETDVLLLADIFESFRKTCLGNYGLDQAHYLSAPRLSWDAFLKRSGSEM
jgi:hypothetical protein